MESRFRPRAKSGPGAVGLAQIMPSTARLLAEPLLGRKVSRRALAKPEVNLALGAALLEALLDHFRGHPALALAAYNAGEGSVRRFGGVPPFPETRRYVTKVLELADVAHN